MRRRLSPFVFVPVVSLVCFLTNTTLVSAQAPDSVGVRAQGMAGAFTAIADDASATWWNPAGLATGAYLNMTVEYGEATDGATPDRPNRVGFALAFPALGLSYYRLTVSQMQPGVPTGTTSAGRQDTGTLSVRSLEVSQFGATFGQSISNHFVVASTLKVVRTEGESDGGLDIGAMTIFGRTRLALMVRNVTEPTFKEDTDPFTLRRQARVGFGYALPVNGLIGTLMVAVDADLLDVETALGDERRVAGGLEAWSRGKSIGGRAGISASTLGETRTSYAGGLSLALKRGIYAEGQLTGGSDVTRRGWSAGARLTF